MPSGIAWLDQKFDGIAKTSIGVITAVSDAEGLDVAYQGGGLVTGLEALESYTSPAVGDVVEVASLNGRMWVRGALGRSGTNLGPNLLPNPGFEFGVVGEPPSLWNAFWGAGGGGSLWLNDESKAHSSGAAVEMEISTLLTGEIRRIQNVDAVVVDPGVTYRMGCWFRGTTADANTVVGLNVVTGATPEEAQFFGGGTSADIASLPVPATWTEVSGTRLIPAGHYYLRAHPTVTANAGHTVTRVYVDDVSLRLQS